MKNIVDFLLSYPSWVKVVLFVELVLSMGLLVFIPRNTPELEKIDPAANLGAYQNINHGTSQNNQIQAETVVVTQGLPVEVPAPIKKRIRDLLRSINPEIIHAIDHDQPNIAVMISQVKLSQLIELSKESDFSDYIELENTNNLMGGGSYNKPGYITDLSRLSPFFMGYILKFKKPLRSA
jgi:hypothetical protein